MKTHCQKDMNVRLMWCGVVYHASDMLCDRSRQKISSSASLSKALWSVSLPQCIATQSSFDSHTLDNCTPLERRPNFRSHFITHANFVFLNTIYLRNKCWAREKTEADVLSLFIYIKLLGNDLPDLSLLSSVSSSVSSLQHHTYSIALILCLEFCTVSSLRSAWIRLVIGFCRSSSFFISTWLCS